MQDVSFSEKRLARGHFRSKDLIISGLKAATSSWENHQSIAYMYALKIFMTDGSQQIGRQGFGP